ncbi:site-specific integrase [Photobacterium leiognathi]|uniref:site-specific integrase n=1 Tax=Photobacterium leiognathi TaxID=553611 RepID=UPI003AF38B7C
MPSIFIDSVTNTKGLKKYKVRVRAFKGEPVTGQKTRTFSTKAKAIAYSKKLNRQFEKNNYEIFFDQSKHYTIGHIINDYLDNPLTKILIKSGHKSPLKQILKTSFAFVTSTNISAHNWYMLALQMKELLQIKPQTAANYLSILHSALKDCITILCYSINLNEYSNGLSTARRIGLIAKTDERKRRPSEFELDKIKEAITNNKISKGSIIPMLDIMEFAIETAARIGEICSNKITWSNWNPKNNCITITNRKSPNKENISSCFELSPKALEIIMRQPRGNHYDPIFPYNAKTVSKYWQVLMRELKIEDLRFHDLRAEALCRLYEKGWSLSAISKVSGHRDLNILNNVYLRLLPPE